LTDDLVSLDAVCVFFYVRISAFCVLRHAIGRNNDLRHETGQEKAGAFCAGCKLVPGS
jgi:hypothetical protein